MEMQVKVCQNCKNDFTIEPEDFDFYKKIKVPPPTFCSECRRQRRLAWRNDISLYSRSCELCKKSVVTVYSKESGVVVYCNKCWWGDNWDPKSYAQNYDFSRPFFEQHKELMLKVPHLALVNDDGIGSVNCEYTQDFAFSKNCYMVFIAWHIENVMYSYNVLAGRDLMDCMNVMSKTEAMYECINCGHSYNLKFSQFCKACVDCAFIYDCKNCTDCFMCSGLVNKKYCYKNKEYSREEYLKILKSYSLDTWSGVQKAQKEFDNFVLTQKHRYSWTLNNNENVSGDIIGHSKNVHNCYVVRDCENCKYVNIAVGVKDSYDMTSGGELSECYEDITCDHSSRNYFGIFSWKNQDVRYTMHCHNSKNLFGCVGLRNANYCIFNKQYTKEEYEELVPKIIEQMNVMPYIDHIGNSYVYGEFYPTELSCFGYNESVAPEHFPLSEDEIKKYGFNWQDNIQRTEGKETLSIKDIPDAVDEINDSILEEILACIECKRNYKVIKNELLFYKKMHIPIPRKCFSCRHASRIDRRNPFKLWQRQCMCDKTTHMHHSNTQCPTGFETSYAPDRPEIVYCEKCYQSEVY